MFGEESAQFSCWLLIVGAGCKAGHKKRLGPINSFKANPSDVFKWHIVIDNHVLHTFWIIVRKRVDRDRRLRCGMNTHPVSAVVPRGRVGHG